VLLIPPEDAKHADMEATPQRGLPHQGLQFMCAMRALVAVIQARMYHRQHTRMQHMDINV
jgi:hypothetical protein